MRAQGCTLRAASWTVRRGMSVSNQYVDKISQLQLATSAFLSFRPKVSPPSQVGLPSQGLRTLPWTVEQTVPSSKIIVNMQLYCELKSIIIWVSRDTLAARQGRQSKFDPCCQDCFQCKDSEYVTQLTAQYPSNDGPFARPTSD